MEEQIKTTIKEEILKHEANLSSYHVNTITDAVYKQLLEYMSLEEMEKVIESFKSEFLGLVDILIPLVDEYESRIEDELNKHMGAFMNKL